MYTVDKCRLIKINSTVSHTRIKLAIPITLTNFSFHQFKSVTSSQNSYNCQQGMFYSLQTIRIMEFNVVLPSSLHEPEASHMPTLEILEQSSDKVTMTYTDSFLIMVTVFLPSYSESKGLKDIAHNTREKSLVYERISITIYF